MEAKEAVRAHWEREVCGTRYAQRSNRSYYEEMERARYELVPYLKDFVKFEFGRGRKVLEIGVGAGTDLSQWVRAGADAVGVDLTGAAVIETRRRLLAMGIREESLPPLRVADAEHLPFPDGAFDIVYSWGVLHHTPDTAAAFREVGRVLRPSGTFVGMIYHTPSIAGFLLWVRHALLKGKPFLSPRRVTFMYLESPGTKVYTLRETEKLLLQAGLRPLHLKSKLGQGDLLELKLSERYKHPFYKLVMAMYPRWFVRLLGDDYERVLLIKAQKD